MLEQFHVPVEDRVYVDVDRMRAATEALFMRCGVDEAGAKASTDVLLTNDLRAVETHGVSNMMRNYVASYMAGTPKPQLPISRSYVKPPRPQTLMAMVPSASKSVAT